MKTVLFTVLAAAATTAAAQATAGFPEGAVAPASAELHDRLAGKVFDVKLSDGASWRLEYKANGYFFINTSRGFSDSGEWKAEDGRLCSKGRKIAGNCSEIRVKDGGIYMQRDSGEVVRFVPR